MPLCAMIHQILTSYTVLCKSVIICFMTISFERNNTIPLLLVDLDECHDGNDGVTADPLCHYCINTEGSYTCTCDPGYRPSPNNSKQCIGEKIKIEFPQNTHLFLPLNSEK